jgi:hypothetical protein
MATPYDEWKTTEPVNDEAEWVRTRADELEDQWLTDKAKVTEAIADALSDDGEDFFAGVMAELLCSVQVTTDREKIAIAGSKAYRALIGPVFERLERDAEVQAQAEWDQSRKDPRD